jgi:hypothetical protein
VRRPKKNEVLARAPEVLQPLAEQPRRPALRVDGGEHQHALRHERVAQAVERGEGIAQMLDDVEQHRRVDRARRQRRGLERPAGDRERVLPLQALDRVRIELEAADVEVLLEGDVEESSRSRSPPRAGAAGGPASGSSSVVDLAGDRGVLRLLVEALGDVVGVAEQRRVGAAHELVVLEVALPVDVARSLLRSAADGYRAARTAGSGGSARLPKS